MFLNVTNHPAAQWSAEQLAAARRWGEIAELPFPAVSASASSAQVEALAEEYATRILAMHPAAVLCQGEMNLTVALVLRLKAAGLPVYAATSTRCSTMQVQPDGSTVKTSQFRFVQFRAY